MTTMKRRSAIWVLLASGWWLAANAGAEETTSPPSSRGWEEIAARFATTQDTKADFIERRYFSFRKEPVELRGEVRISSARGLSLHYFQPEERTMIIDAQGMLLRDRAGKDAPPPDPRAGAANHALRQVLRFDFAALEKDFSIVGEREEPRWSVTLTPRGPAMRRAVGEIVMRGEHGVVQHLELRRSEKQRIEIRMERVIAAPFTAEEIARYFR